jgi:two-component system sporulation sensor kinase A
MDEGYIFPQMTPRSLSAMTQSTFSFAFQQAPIGMAIVQTDGTLLQMNNWLHTLCGCAEQELIGQRFHHLLYPEDRHVYEQIVKVSEDGPSSAPVIVRLIGRDSTITQVKLTVQLVEKTETEPPNVLVFINTLSDPLTSERMIQTIKGWDQSLFLHNPAMIVSVNLKGYIYAANEAAEQITGYAIEDLIGQEGYMFLDDEQDVLHNNLYQGTSFEQPVAYEARIRRKDGKLIEMGMKNVPIIIDGKVAGLYLIGRDITEIKQSLASKEKAELELWETLQNQQGMTFKFKKMNGEFIHTLCDGKLLYRMGLTPDLVDESERARTILGKRRS